jgi:hypothetical protein
MQTLSREQARRAALQPRPAVEDNFPVTPSRADAGHGFAIRDTIQLEMQ